jgi:hypothetical protein
VAPTRSYRALLQRDAGEIQRRDHDLKEQVERRTRLKMILDTAGRIRHRRRRHITPGPAAAALLGATPRLVGRCR